MNEPAVAVPAGKARDPEAIQRRTETTTKRKNINQKNLVGYLFISPWLLGFLIFTLVPIAISLWLAFTNYDLLSGKWEYVGLENFERMFFRDVRYGRSVVATFRYVVAAVPLRLLFALAVAMLLNTNRCGVYWYRAAYYVPSVIGGSIAIAVMWAQIFGREGVVNALLLGLGIPKVSWLGNPQTAIWTLILLAVWQFGSPMLIFLAGLRQIPQELYESASIDGANGWHKFLRVTLPLLTPIIFFNVIMQMISGLKVFTQAFIITEGAPLDTTLFYALYVYNRAFETYEMGYAAAMSWIMLLVIAVLTAISFKLSSLWVFYETKEG